MSEPSAKAGYYMKVKALVEKFWDPERGGRNNWIDAFVNVYGMSTLIPSLQSWPILPS